MEPGDPQLPPCGAPELSGSDFILSFKIPAPLPETWRLVGGGGDQQLRLQLSLPCPLTAGAPGGQRRRPLPWPRAPMSGTRQQQRSVLPLGLPDAP